MFANADQWRRVKLEKILGLRFLCTLAIRTYVVSNHSHVTSLMWVCEVDFSPSYVVISLHTYRSPHNLTDLGTMDIFSKRNCRAVTSPKKQMNKLFFLSWWLWNTWNLNFDFKFQLFLGCQYRKTNLFVCFWEKLTLDNFVSSSTDL